MDNLGESIRRQREANKMTIEELSDKTKISPAILRDIEAGMFDRYKGDEAYVKMYLKKITSVIKMDSEQVTQQYIDLTKEIKLEELHRKEEHEVEKHPVGKKFSFEAPQLTRKPSVYEDKSHITLIRTGIILILICLVIVVVWYGIYMTRSSSEDPNFKPNQNPTVEGEIDTPDNNDDKKDDPNQDDNQGVDANIVMTKKAKLNFDFVLPTSQQEFVLKIEFMQKSWAKLYVNGKVYNDFESKIYHSDNTEEPEVVELTFKASEVNQIRLRTGYSMGHRYYINGQLVPLEDEDYSEGATDLKLNVVKQ